jgi:hypothetical protein
MEASLTYMQKVQLNYLATLTMCRIKMAHNGSGIAEGMDLKAECFNLAQMPNRSTND